VAVIIAGNGNIFKVGSVPKWQLIGGALGVVYLLVMTSIVPVIGFASFTVATIASQMLLSMTLDHFGVFSNRIPFDPYRIVGLVLLFIALFLIFRGGKA
jgi:bacterial/archaeal transporter family-2 protein